MHTYRFYCTTTVSRCDVMGEYYDYWCIDRYIGVFIQIGWSVVCGIP